MFVSTETRLLYPYRQVLGTVTLSAEKRQLFEERYLRLLETSFRRCRKIALVYNMNRLTITVGSILVPAILSIQRTDYLTEKFSAAQTIFWFTWAVSLMVTVSNGLMTMFKFDRKYYLFHAAFEQLKTEGWQYLALTGNYKGAADTHTHEQQFGMFAHTVERIRMRQTEEEYVKLQDVAGIRQVAVGSTGLGSTSATAIPTVFDYGKTPGKDDLLQALWSYLKQQPLQKGTENSIVESGIASDGSNGSNQPGSATTGGGLSPTKTVILI